MTGEIQNRDNGGKSKGLNKEKKIRRKRKIINILTLNKNPKKGLKKREVFLENICLLKDDNGNITSDYGFTYNKLSDLLASGKYYGYIKDGDWIEITTSDLHTYRLYANIDPYYHCGPNGNYLIGNHIDFISDNLIVGSRYWTSGMNCNINDELLNHLIEENIDFLSDNLINSSQCLTTLTGDMVRCNSGNELVKSPFLSSIVNSKLERYFTTLPKGLRDHIVPKYNIVPYRFTSNYCGNLCNDTGLGWEDMGNLWIPYEKEIFGENIYSSRKYEKHMKQYHIFKDINDFSIKCEYSWSDIIPIPWLTASACMNNSKDFCCVGTLGDSYNIKKSYSRAGIGVPLCFRFI